MSDQRPTSPLFADNAELKKGKRTSGQKILMFVLIVIVVVLVFVIMAQNSEQTIQDREKESRRTSFSDPSKLKNDLLEAARSAPTPPPKVETVVPEEQMKSPQIIVLQPPAPTKTARRVTDTQKEEGKRYRDLKQNSLTGKSAVEGFSDLKNESETKPPQEEMLARLLALGAGAGGIAGAGSAGNAELQAALAAIGKSPQQNKLDFLTQEGGGRTPQGYSESTRKAQIAPLELKAGTVLPGLLLTGINSDLPGMVLGQISENVYDTATGAWLLIPQGARLLGVYDSQITQGQKRVGIVWNRIVYPDGSSLNIAGSPGADMAGYIGIKGKVDHHYSQLLLAGLFTSFFTAAVDIASDNKDDTAGNNNQKKSAKDVLVETTGTTIANIGAKLAEKALEIQPTIVIKPGSRFNVMVQQDVIFPEPWREPTTNVSGF